MSDVRRKRTKARAEARDAAKLTRDRQRLFRLEPGGSSERPIEVSSAAVVEGRALGLRCPRCEGAFTLVGHDAVSVGEVRLRKVQVQCRTCAAGQQVWLRVLGDLLN